MSRTPEKIIHDFTQTLQDFNKSIAGIPETGLDWRVKKDEWSIRQIIHHLTDDCNVYTFIIERALATPGCKVFFGGFPGNEAWADQLAYNTRPTNIPLKLMQVQRAFIADLLLNFPDRLDNKVGYHNETGELITEQSVRDMITMLTEHMQEHITMIEAIVRANQQ